MTAKGKGGVPTAPEAGGAVVPFEFDEEDIDVGYEGADKYISLAFLDILESKSPQVERDDPVGAKAGMLINKVTNELFNGMEKGVVFMPVFQDHGFVEWIPRKQGGGFVTRHPDNSKMVKDAIARNRGKSIGKLKCGDRKEGEEENSSNDLVDTFYVYGMIMDEEGKEALTPVVLAFTSTRIKPFRHWFTQMMTQLIPMKDGTKKRPPLYANRARIKTVRVEKSTQIWYNFKISPFKETWLDSLISPKDQGELLVKARELRKLVDDGYATPTYEHSDSPEAGDGGGGAGDTEVFTDAL